MRCDPGYAIVAYLLGTLPSAAILAQLEVEED
jgi:hypothetical protein